MIKEAVWQKKTTYKPTLCICVNLVYSSFHTRLVAYYAPDLGNYESTL